MISLLSCEGEESQQDQGNNGMAGWNGTIGAGLHAMEESFMVAAGVKAPTNGVIPITLQQMVRRLAGLLQIPSMRRCFECVQQGGGETGCIVQISVQAPPARRDRTIDSSVFDRVVKQKGDRPLSSRQVRGNPKRLISIEIGGDHHRIPTRENIVVPLRHRPLLACCKQLRSGRVQRKLYLFLRFGPELSLTEPIQHVLTFEVAVLCHSIVTAEFLCHVTPQHRDNLFPLPDEVGSLMPFTIGILRGEECAVLACEFTANVL